MLQHDVDRILFRQPPRVVAKPHAVGAKSLVIMRLLQALAGWFQLRHGLADSDAPICLRERLLQKTFRSMTSAGCRSAPPHAQQRAALGQAVRKQRFSHAFLKFHKKIRSE
jgi:hypothetical protein